MRLSLLIRLACVLQFLLIPLQTIAISQNDLHAVNYDTLYYEEGLGNGCVSLGSPGVGSPLGMKMPNIDPQALVDSINKYIDKVHPDSPFKGKGDVFVKAGQKANVNPALGIAQGQIESQLGLSDYARQHNNAFGLGGTNPINFSNIMDSVDYFFSDKYLASPQKYTDIKKYIYLYAPPSENQTEAYIKNIRTIMSQIVNNLPNGSGGTISADAGSGCSEADAAAQNGDFIKKVAFGFKKNTITPTAIVLHFTASADASIETTIKDLKSNTSGGCTPYCTVQLATDASGKTYQLTEPLNVETSHACGINSEAIGIEIGGRDEAQLLANSDQFNGVVNAVVSLVKKYNIPLVDDPANKKGIMSHQEADKQSYGCHSGKIDPGETYKQKVIDAVKQRLGSS